MFSSSGRFTVERGRTHSSSVGADKERAMRKAILALAMCGGCISGGSVVVHDNPEPDTSSGSRVMRQVMRQDLWAQQALNSRPTPQQLETLRSGRDQGSTQRARKE